MVSLNKAVIIHAHLLQPIHTGAFSSTCSFGLSNFKWLDDKVVEFGQDIYQYRVDLEFDLLSALWMKRAHISN